MKKIIIIFSIIVVGSILISILFSNKNLLKKQNDISVSQQQNDNKISKEELKNYIKSVKSALEDTKATGNMSDPKVKSFVEKMESKIEKLEKEYTNGQKTASEIIKELEDKSDVE